MADPRWGGVCVVRGGGGVVPRVCVCICIYGSVHTIVSKNGTLVLKFRNHFSSINLVSMDKGNIKLLEKNRGKIVLPLNDDIW